MDQDTTPIAESGESAALLAQQNEYAARLVEQNMVIIDLLERAAELQREVTIANFNMPFWALVGFLIKVALASIPALLVLAIVGFVLSLVFAALGFAVL